jgi:hypothetical protein
MKKVLILFTLAMLLSSCGKDIRAGAESAPGTLSAEAAAKKIAGLIPEGWQLSKQLQPEPAISAYDYSGDGRHDFIALLEKIPSGSDDKNPLYAIFYAQSGGDGKLQQVFMNRGAFQENQSGSFTDASLAGFLANEKEVRLSFKGGNDWQWTARYVFTYEDRSFYLNNAETVVWHKSDPNAIDQKEYDFKSYFLRSTVISDCGDISCKEIQGTGDNDKLRVDLADFHYTDSLVSFADLL